MDVPYFRPLTHDEQQWLLSEARRAIAAHLGGGESVLQHDDPPLGCHQHLACFVSLHGTDAQLRGSMGALQRHEPLWRQVGQIAVAAAVRDPRFRPLSLAELERVALEVTCLSPPQPVAPQLVRPHVDGVWVECGAQRGVLLPGALKEMKIGTEAYLAEACRRAQLAPDAWRRDDVQLARFVTQVFSEVDRLQ